MALCQTKLSLVNNYINSCRKKPFNFSFNILLWIFVYIRLVVEQRLAIEFHRSSLQLRHVMVLSRTLISCFPTVRNKPHFVFPQELPLSWKVFLVTTSRNTSILTSSSQRLIVINPPKCSSFSVTIFTVKLLSGVRVLYWVKLTMKY